MRVERIEPSRHQKGRVLLFLEDGSLLKITEQELLDFGLRAGDELDGDTLRFYAYAAGSGDLSLRVYYKESGSTANNGTRLLPADDRNFSVRLTLNQSYTFSLYLYRDGRRVGDAAVYHISYRARLADDDQPEIGDAPPVITTSRDGRTDPVSVQTMTFVVWARTGTDGSPIYTSHLQVSMDGELLTNPTGSAATGYEYVLRFSAPLVGDEREYTLRILAWDDAGNSAMRTVKRATTSVRRPSASTPRPSASASSTRRPSASGRATRQHRPCCRCWRTAAMRPAMTALRKRTAASTLCA